MVATEGKRRKDSLLSRHLNTPVISVGGISMGGAGKTPMVEYLATQMNAAGLAPAILTRGYRRRSIAPRVAIKAGADCPGELDRRRGADFYSLRKRAHRDRRRSLVDRPFARKDVFSRAFFCSTTDSNIGGWLAIWISF